MEQLLLKAATTATDEGVFEAVISTANPDRDGDIVEPSAMVNALSKWASLGKQVPLAWAHTEEIVGSVDPATAAISGDEVTAKGRIDQSTDRGQVTWRLVKSGTLSFSFGYLIPKGGATKRTGGRYHITELDVFEISVVPVGPANNDTRVLSFKSAEDLRAHARQVASDIERERIADVPDEQPEPNPLEDAIKAIGEITPEALAKALDGFDVNGTRLYVRLIDTPEHEGVKAGEIKAVWSTAYVNNLPDSAFLYIEPGGTKDSEGKTVPRDKRHFPYKDADGNVDLPHLRNALARIPQSQFIPDNTKEELTRKARQILDRQKSVEATGKEHKARSVDPLRTRAMDTALDVMSDGAGTEPPTQVKQHDPQDEAAKAAELRAYARDLVVQTMSGTQ